MKLLFTDHGEKWYSENSLEKIYDQVSTNILEKFETKFNKLKDFDAFCKKLSERLRALFEKYKIQNDTLIKEKELLILQQFEECRRQYIFEMKEQLNRINCDSDLEGYHKSIKDKYLNGFLMSNSFNDQAMCEHYSNQLQQILNDSVQHIKDLVIAKFHNRCVETYNQVN